MKYPKIAALVPAGEHFDESAIVNEGGYLSTAHLASVEKNMSDTAAAVSAHETVVKDLNDKIASAEAAKKTAEDTLATANSTIEANTTMIATLTADNAKLKKSPAKEATATTIEKDVSVVETVIKDKKDKYRTSFDEQAEKYR